MSRALRARTVLPPDDPADLARFARELRMAGSRIQLLGADGSVVELPGELHALLWDVVTALSEGLAISIAPHNTMLTTQEAADLLGISRPTLVRLLGEGEIPHVMRGRHRRVMLRDVLDYQERCRRGRRQALDRMTAEAEVDGLYELPLAP